MTFGSCDLGTRDDSNIRSVLCQSPRDAFRGATEPNRMRNAHSSLSWSTANNKSHRDCAAAGLRERWCFAEVG